MKKMKMKAKASPYNLQRFNSMDAHHVILRLLKDGYKPVNQNPGCRIFRDAAAAHLVTVCNAPALGEAFTRACMATPVNPHLPRVLDYKTLNSGLHLRVTENLHACVDFPEDVRITIFGQARAFSTLFEGDEMHVNVHPLLRESAPLVEAVRRVVACGAALTDPTRTNALGVRLDQRGHSVLFRTDTNEAVFASPLVPAIGSLKLIHQRLKLVETRFSDAEMANPQSRFWQKSPACKVA